MKNLLFVFGILLFISCESLNTENNVFDDIFEETFQVDRKHKNFDNTSLQVGDSIVATIVKIHDGDTYDALVKEQGKQTTIRIRMYGIDAPERGMPFSRKSTEYLKSLTNSENVGIKIYDIDHYDRGIAFTYLKNGKELSHEMVKAGFAWHYKQYNKDKDLAELEIEARKQKLGLWKDKNPISPWEHRRMEREK